MSYNVIDVTLTDICQYQFTDKSHVLDNITRCEIKGENAEIIDK